MTTTMIDFNDYPIDKPKRFQRDRARRAVKLLNQENERRKIWAVLKWVLIFGGGISWFWMMVYLLLQSHD